MLVYGEVIPLSRLSPGEWFVLMRRGIPDCEDSLEPTETPFKLVSVDGETYNTRYIWHRYWYPQKMLGTQLVCRCDVTR